ncbi:unnamed protein product, partial [Laminaria digitata]
VSLIPGGSANIRSALDRLSAALRTHPYSRDIEEVIYLLAIGQSALPADDQTVESANGSLQYLEYLKEGYAPAQEGPPTVTSYPCWDLIEAPVNRDAQLLSPGGGSALSGTERGGHAGGLCVEGLPVWALQFQLGTLAFRVGESARAMAAMEGAFLSYETWLPRSSEEHTGDCPDEDGIRRAWYQGLPMWSAWVKHPRPWLDLGDIAYRQGVGSFHVAGEAYKAALQRAGDTFSPDKKQAAIMFRMVKCCSRCGDKAGAVAGLERLLYEYNFWDERYRSARSAAAALRLVRDSEDAIVQKIRTTTMRHLQGVCWRYWLIHHDFANQDKAAAKIQGLARGMKARGVVKVIVRDRQARERLEQLVENMGASCVKKRCLRRLAKQIVVNR